MRSENAQLTGTARNDALPPLLLRQTRHEIIRPPDLEAEHLLQIFSLQVHLVPELRAEVRRMDERGLGEDVVHFGGEDEAEVVWVARWEDVVRSETGPWRRGRRAG